MSLVGEQNMLFVYRNYPLSNHCNANMGQEGHKFACELAAAARCAGQQGKFWEYKKWVFDHLEDGAQNGEKIFSSDALVAQATSLGLSGSGFKQCLDSKIELEKIKEDISFGQKLKITGTPLLVIGGKIYSGPMTASGLASAIKQELNQFN
jgi:protein-disulfide isomerase